MSYKIEYKGSNSLGHVTPWLTFANLTSEEDARTVALALTHMPYVFDVRVNGVSPR